MTDKQRHAFDAMREALEDAAYKFIEIGESGGVLRNAHTEKIAIKVRDALALAAAADKEADDERA